LPVASSAAASTGRRRVPPSTMYTVCSASPYLRAGGALCSECMRDICVGV
jgi:hypothetical protein